MCVAAAGYVLLAPNDKEMRWRLRLVLVLLSVGMPMGAAAQQIFFSEYAEGTALNRYLEIYNPTSAPVALSGYAFPNVANSPATTGVHEHWNTTLKGLVGNYTEGDAVIMMEAHAAVRRSRCRHWRER